MWQALTSSVPKIHFRYSQNKKASIPLGVSFYLGSTEEKDACKCHLFTSFTSNFFFYFHSNIITIAFISLLDYKSSWNSEKKINILCFINKSYKMHRKKWPKQFTKLALFTKILSCLVVVILNDLVILIYIASPFAFSVTFITCTFLQTWRTCKPLENSFSTNIIALRMIKVLPEANVLSIDDDFLDFWSLRKWIICCSLFLLIYTYATYLRYMLLRTSMCVNALLVCVRCVPFCDV